MATNYIQEGRIMTVLAPATVVSGDEVQVGQLFGIAQRDAASGAEVEIDTQGVYTVTKNNLEAWAVGDAIYWNGTAATITATANTLIGVATAVAVNPSVLGNVRLNGSFKADGA